MSLEQNKAIARLFVEEVLSKGQYHRFDDLTAPNYIDHNLPPGVTARMGISGFRAGFPDTQFTINDMVAEGDKVVVRYELRGTHTGNFLGIPPTGRTFHMTGMSMYRIIGGKISESWVQYDQLGLMQQLGLVPMPN